MLNFSEWKGDDSYTLGVYQGFFLGPSISLKASDKISIEPSILLSKKGTKLKRMIDVEEDGESLFLDSRHVYTLTYIDVPVVVRYDILPGLNLLAAIFLLAEKQGYA